MKGTSYYEFELAGNREFYRAYPDNIESGWVMDFDPRAMDGNAIRDIAALPKKLTSAAVVRVPVNATFGVRPHLLR